MQTVRGIYQGIILLSLFFVSAATFICICLLGRCTDEWLPWNLVIGCVAEVILFVWGVRFLKKGATKVLEENRGNELVKDLYERIAYLMCFGIAFALIILIFYYLSGSMDGYSLNPVLIYSLNIIIPALFFLVWMLIRISKENKKLKD